MKRNILFVTTGLLHSTGGIASANRNVYSALKTIALDTQTKLQTLVLSESGRSNGSYLAFGGQKVPFALSIALMLPRAKIAVFDHVRLAMPLMAFPSTLRPPTVIFAHGSESWKRVRKSSIAAFRASDLVLTNSNYTLRKMQARFDQFNGLACPLGLPPQFQPTAAPPPKSNIKISLLASDGHAHALGNRVLLLVGRMDLDEQEKGHRELMSALPLILQKFPETQLVCVGNGTDLLPLKSLASTLSYAKHIFFTGQIDDQQLNELYQKAYAYVMPSRQEGFGLVYLEAMNFALPCIACRDDGGADVVVHNETGLLVDQPISLKQLAKSVIALLSDERRARELGEAGWRRLHEEFSSQAHQSRVIRHILPILK